MRDKIYRFGFWFMFLLIIAMTIASCSTRDQTRFEGTINLGDLPSDMLYVNGVPQANISSESDGDIILSYTSNDHKMVGQLYGCAYISLNCGEFYKQGRYEFNIPEDQWLPTGK